MIGAQSDSIGTGAGGSESLAGEEFDSSASRLPWRVRSILGSITAENTAFMAGSIQPSMDAAIGSELGVGAVVGAVS